MSNTKRSTGPDFICVGPEKTGTTWLYHNLSQHPDVFLPPMKELRFFYEEFYYPEESPFSRLSKNGDWHAQRYRQYLKSRRNYYIRHPLKSLFAWRRFLWDCRVLFGKRTADWYLRLFASAGSSLAGDISPQYFFLPEEQISRICELLPSAKIILFQRNPIDWCWSFGRMTILKDGNLDAAADHELMACFDNVLKNYRFVPAIKRWQHFVPKERLFIGFYDLLDESPWELFRQICAYLNIDPRRLPPSVSDQISKRINPGKNVAIPPHMARYLARKWEGEIDAMCQMFHPYAQIWKEHCVQLLENKNT